MLSWRYARPFHALSCYLSVSQITIIAICETFYLYRLWQCEFGAYLSSVTRSLERAVSGKKITVVILPVR